jgi:uncharacterized membrane protein
VWRTVRVLGPILLLAGLALLADAIATGGARLYLLVIIPVVTGTSAVFGISVALLASGFLLLPLSFAGDPAPVARSGNSATSPHPTDSTDGGTGGMILVGPIPFFFGAWRRSPPISYRWAVVIGAVLAFATVLLLWGFSWL